MIVKDFVQALRTVLPHVVRGETPVPFLFHRIIPEYCGHTVISTVHESNHCIDTNDDTSCTAVVFGQYWNNLFYSPEKDEYKILIGTDSELHFNINDLTEEFIFQQSTVQSTAVIDVLTIYYELRKSYIHQFRVYHYNFERFCSVNTKVLQELDKVSE